MKTAPGSLQIVWGTIGPHTGEGREMHIVSTAKFVIGLVFLAIALGFLPLALKERGFGKFRQLSTLALIASAIFVARGVGLVEL